MPGHNADDRRRDAAVAVANWPLYVERRASEDGDSVGTIGILQVPNGSTNVVPGRCQFTLDLRAPTDAQRDALVADVLANCRAILRTPAAAPHAGRDHARGGAQRAPMAGALGTRQWAPWASPCTACPVAPATTR